MKSIGLFLLVVLSTSATYYFVSPHLAYKTLRENLEHNKSEALLASLDLPRLRENIKRSTNQWIDKEFEFGEVGRLISGVVTSGLVDTVGSDKFIRDLVWDKIENFPDGERIEHNELGRVTVYIPHDKGEISLVMDMQNLRWRVVDLGWEEFPGNEEVVETVL